MKTTKHTGTTGVLAKVAQRANVSGGTVVVTMCREGLEGMSVDISGGIVYVNSKSDGINAAGGSDQQGFDGAGAGFAANGNNSINISG